VDGGDVSNVLFDSTEIGVAEFWDEAIRAAHPSPLPKGYGVYTSLKTMHTSPETLVNQSF
jgi:hypothetical protein